MLFLRELNGEIFKKIPELEQIATLNGQEFATTLKSSKIGIGKYIALTSGDMDNAYTNVRFEDLDEAVKLLCHELNTEEWRTQLIIKLSYLVLHNNYVETSIGILKIGPCLPMGNCASGEALDTVAIASEMKIKVEKFHKTVDILEIPEQVQEKIEETKGTILKSKLGAVMEMKRYRDDMYGLLASENLKEIVMNILEMGTIYPKHIKVTVQLGHFY